jgi:pentatricopeptide repeat protein
VAAHLTALKACRMLGAWQHAIGILGVLAASARAPWLSQLQQLATSAAADFSAAAEPANGGAHRPPPVFDTVVRETTPRASFDNAFHEMAVSHAMGACVRHRDASGQPSAAALEAAQALLSMLEQHGLVRAAHYGACMHALVLRGQPGSAFELYQHARRQGVTFGVIESNVALSAAARSGRLSEAVQLLVEMADPDVGSYDAVLARLVSTARHQDALALFERMLASGLSPLEHHYRIAIGACASIAQGGRAAELLLDMQARGMVFSAAAADAMHACNAAGMPEVALDIFEAIRFEAATPNSAAATSAANSVHVFNAALDALRRQSEPSAAVDLLLSMHSKHSAEPLGSSYAIALSACRRSGRLDMLPRVLQAAVEHSERRPGWLCTDELHSELVRSLAEAGEPHAALRCYVQLVQARVPLSAALYNALLPALERCAGAGVLGLSTLGTALGTRGRSAVVSARMRDPHERRIDAADGKPYSRDEFADFYGDDADLMWAAAARITSSVGAHGGPPTGAAAPGSVAAEAAAAPALRVVEHGLAMGAFGETLSLAGELLEINLSPFTTPAALRAAVHYWAHALRAQLDALDGDVALTDVVFLAGASADSSAEEASSVRTASRVALVSEQLKRLRIPHGEAQEVVRFSPASVLALRAPVHLAPPEKLVKLLLTNDGRSSAAAADAVGADAEARAATRAAADGRQPELIALLGGYMSTPSTTRSTAPSTTPSSQVEHLIERLRGGLAPTAVWEQEVERRRRRAATRALVRRHKGRGLAAEGEAGMYGEAVEQRHSAEERAAERLREHELRSFELGLLQRQPGGGAHRRPPTAGRRTVACGSGRAVVGDLGRAVVGDERPPRLERSPQSGAEPRAEPTPRTMRESARELNDARLRDGVVRAGPSKRSLHRSSKARSDD